MKKLFFGALTMVALLASCSSEDDVVANNNQAGENDLVEIKLGTGSRIGMEITEARAAVEEWKATEVGIFALDRHGVTINQQVTPPDWTETVTTDDKAVVLDNIKGVIGDTNTGVAAGENSTTAITLGDGTTTYYYPRTSERQYDFYGYYPYTNESTNIVKEAQKITIKGEFNGSQDIMAGKAVVPTTNATAWNSKYYRDLAKVDGFTDYTEDQHPIIVFKHLTSRFKVTLIKGTSYKSEFCKVKQITANLPKNYELTLASLATDFTAPTLTFIESTSTTTPGADGGESTTTTESNMADVNLLNETDFEDNKATEAYESTTTGLTPNIDFMVPANKASYTLNIKFTQKVSSDENAEYIVSPVTINIANITNNTETTTPTVFEAGKIYNVKLVINGPSEIKVFGTLEEWKEGGDFEYDI